MNQDFNAFYRDIRSIETQVGKPDGEELLRDTIYRNLANAAAAGMAVSFTRATLELFGGALSCDS